MLFAGVVALIIKFFRSGSVHERKLGEMRGFWLIYCVSILVAGVLAQKLASVDLPLTWNFDEWKQVYNRIYASKSVHTVGPTNIVEELWINLVTYLGDFHLLVLFYITMNTFYCIGGVFFWACDYFQLLHKYKIQSKVRKRFRILIRNSIILPPRTTLSAA